MYNSSPIPAVARRDYVDFTAQNRIDTRPTSAAGEVARTAHVQSLLGDIRIASNNNLLDARLMADVGQLAAAFGAQNMDQLSPMMMKNLMERLRQSRGPGWAEHLNALAYMRHMTNSPIGQHGRIDHTLFSPEIFNAYAELQANLQGQGHLPEEGHLPPNMSAPDTDGAPGNGTRRGHAGNSGMGGTAAALSGFQNQLAMHGAYAPKSHVIYTDKPFRKPELELDYGARPATVEPLGDRAPMLRV